ncbi:hypothetical protein QVD17_13966 [Tagetes erecta]|uniref:Uncharacterized protein n=1 Tax=Tagetes erecta TaxID=13708 RepID=A0AAD8P2E7_TARER|nr:hypothetical protein QVD17_13966 [Tagetes erecta]
MGCIFSKSSNHQQDNVQVIIPNHHFVSPTNSKHTLDDHVLELLPPKHDDDHSLIIHTNLKTVDALERCSNFHTVEEYDKLVQRISNYNDAKLAAVPVPVPETTYLTYENDSNSVTRRDQKKEDTEFQTVASLRQWLHAPVVGDEDAKDVVEYMAQKVGFSFHENNSNSNSNSNSKSNNTRGSEENSVLIKTGKQEEEETIVELVAAFDEYMLQLQIDEDNILKQIHNMIK